MLCTHVLLYICTILGSLMGVSFNTGMYCTSTYRDMLDKN